MTEEEFSYLKCQCKAVLQIGQMPTCAAKLIIEFAERLAERDERARVLGAALAEAIEDIEEWGAYAGDYFKDKHGLAECIAKHRAALAEKE